MFALIYGAYVDLPRRYKVLLYLIGGLVCFIGAFLIQNGVQPQPDLVQKSFHLQPGTTQVATQLQSEVVQAIARVGAVFLGLTAFALIVGVIAGADEERLFRKCLEAFEDRVRHQREKGIYGIRPGGKLYDFLKAVEYEEGDRIDVLWSYLQHEEVTERIFEEVKGKRLSVRFLLMMPFSEGLELRVRDLARDYSGDLFEYLHEKSLGNVQFLRRYLQYVKQMIAPSSSGASSSAFLSRTFRYVDSKLQAHLDDIRDLEKEIGKIENEIRSDTQAIDDIRNQIEVLGNDKKEGAGEDISSRGEQLDAYRRKVSERQIKVESRQTQIEAAQSNVRALSGQAQSMELRYTEQYFARPMVICQRRNKGGEYDVVSVAMGFFLTDEASKYPIMVFRNEDVGQARNVCEDAETYFDNKYKDAFFGRSFWEAVRENVARQPRGAFLSDDVRKWERMIGEICISRERDDRPGEWRDARLDPPTL